MNDYIKRKDAYMYIHAQYPQLLDAGVQMVVNAIPASDVRPVVRARWEQIEVSYFEDMDDERRESLAIASMYCPKCKRYHNEVYIYGNPTEHVNFCGFCGADMRRT